MSYRMAWIIAILAPASDPVLASTLPFCLENIESGASTFDDLCYHVLRAVPVNNVAPVTDEQWRLLARPTHALRGDIHHVLSKRRRNPSFYDALIEHLTTTQATSLRECANPFVAKDPHEPFRRSWDTGPSSRPRAKQLVDVATSASPFRVRVAATRELLKCVTTPPRPGHESPRPGAAQRHWVYAVCRACSGGATCTALSCLSCRSCSNWRTAHGGRSSARATPCGRIQYTPQHTSPSATHRYCRGHVVAMLWPLSRSGS